MGCVTGFRRNICQCVSGYCVPVEPTQQYFATQVEEFTRFGAMCPLLVKHDKKVGVTLWYTNSTNVIKRIIEGSLEVKLPTIWTVGKCRGGKSQRGEEKKWEDQRIKKMQVREKVGKSTIHCAFSNDLWLRRVEKSARYGGGCGASWPDKRWKIARRCGVEHISKSKCKKHNNFGPLLEVAMSKKCTPL